jgi:glyoxylase-like metal-dependent hydrolase (beta-lactamase superfamily II)
LRILTLPVGPLQTNCYLIGCPATGQAAAIDPGWSGADIFQAAQDAGLTLTHMLLTHAHFDHVGGAAELSALSAAQLLVHPDAAPSLARAHLEAEWWGLKLPAAPEPDAYLADGQTVTIGTLQIQVLDTPGHAPGHVSFYHAESQSAFDGDVLFSGGIGRTDLPGGNYPQLMRSIRDRLLLLPDETTLYPGHGPSTTVGDERRYNPFLR